MGELRIPEAPLTLQKGDPLKQVLGAQAVACLAHNLRLVPPSLDAHAFAQQALEGLEPLGIIERGEHIARALRAHLLARYATAIGLLLDTLTPPLTRTEVLRPSERSRVVPGVASAESTGMGVREAACTERVERERRSRSS